MKGSLTWTFTLLAVGTVIVIFMVTFLGTELDIGLETDARLKATELSSKLNILISSDDTTRTLFTIPKSECEIEVNSKFVNITIGIGDKKGTSFIPVVDSDVEIEKFSDKCENEAMTLSLVKQDNKISIQRSA